MSSSFLGVEKSLGGYRWLWRGAEDAQGQARRAQAICQREGVPEIVARLLVARGIGPEQAGLFLEPSLKATLRDPSCFQDMDTAAERMARAVMDAETVGIFGDYDVDGTCSTAIFTLLLRQLGCTVLTHIPDRIREGYGPNTPALQALINKGARLILCVDCGSLTDSYAPLGNQADIVVFDHHAVHGALSPTLATVNPNRPDCPSGQKNLCAAGVVFMACIALVRSLRQKGFFNSRAEPDLLSFLDLVALATICDVMTLTGVNRTLVRQGLKVLGRRQRLGLAALMEVAGCRGVPDAYTCGFALGPRINAGGRIAESGLGLALVLAEDAPTATTLAERLDAINRQRQAVESDILQSALHQGEAQIEQGHKVVMLSGRDWHPGVVGIVAGRLKEHFQRPAFVGAVMGDGTVKGSGRSVAGLDIGRAVTAAREAGLIMAGGGHSMAAGFTLSEGAEEAFHAFLDSSLAGAEAGGVADLFLEGSLSLRAASSSELALQISRLAPFGNGNEEPLFALTHVRVLRADRIGREGQTLRLMLAGEDGARLKALMFRAQHDNPVACALESRDARPLHLSGWLRAEEWNGRLGTSFFIKDAAFA